MKRALILLILIGVVGGATWQWGPTLWQRLNATSSANAADPAARFFEVTPRTIVIDYTATGSLQAVKHHRVQMELEKQSQATILWLQEEGAEVKEGQEILKLDPQPIRERIEQKENELKVANNLVPQKESWLQFERSFAKSAISGAQESLQKSIDSLKKFRQWDAPNEFQKLDESIAGAKEAYEKAVKEERDAEIAVDEVSFGDDEKRLQLQKAFENFALKTAAAIQGMDRVELQKRIYQTYNYPDQLSALQKAVERAELDLQKTRLRAAADIEKAEKDLEDAAKNVEKIEDELKIYRKDLERCIIVAPSSGILLYGQGESNRGGRQSDLKVGGTVFRGTLMTIPQAGGYKIEIEVGEHVRARLKAGNEAVVTFEAIPNLNVKATLKEISRYATRKRSWDENSPRAFRGEIELHSDDARMISGLTGQVRIIVDTIENCLAVPIESVFNEDGQTICYVSTDNGPERRSIKTGRSNDDYVEITSGLATGEKIYVDSPDAGTQEVEPEPVAPASKS